MRSTFWSRVVLTSFLFAAGATQGFGDPVPAPFILKPFNTYGLGNSAANYSGFFRQNGGPPQFRYFLGTNITPGSLTMQFATPFTTGPGSDFAISTSAQAWGPLADVALFQFFFGKTLEASFTAHLAPNQLFTFDLPGHGLIVNRVIITNITPDPPGINNLATMTFDDAGARYTSSHVVPEPSSFMLFGSGLLAIFGSARRFLH